MEKDNNMNILYHYTNIDGFMGIINHSTDKMGLWMSSADYMNDKSERIHSIKVLANMVEAAENLVDGNKLFTPFFQQLAKNEPWKLLRYFNQYVQHIDYYCTLSLSRRRDYLPLWGRYANSGNGVAIGIDEDAIKSIAESNNMLCNDVCYTNGTQMNKGQFLDYLKPAIEKGHKECLEDGKSPQDVVNTILYAMCGFLKNSSFEYEEEVRIAQFTNKRDSNIKYRPSNKGIIPYRVIEVDKSAIKEIIAGPSDEPYLLKNSIADFCLYGNIGQFRTSEIFKNSDIPFRK